MNESKIGRHSNLFSKKLEISVICLRYYIILKNHSMRLFIFMILTMGIPLPSIVQIEEDASDDGTSTKSSTHQMYLSISSFVGKQIAFL